MPLSEYEQRVLEQMEQQLRSDDPKLADAISGTPTRRPLHVVLGTLVALAGLGMLVGGVASQFIPLGIVGFLAMFGGVMWAISRPRAGSPSKAGDPGKASNVRRMKPRKSSFMTRLEERWDRRRGEGQ
ncbi:DUF3040 domain-containing protein [Occultella glacieicola]|uniref:DUF3040 domain-containing protein n=1 Tax=Occultella glacieicola TaxID=2518684 RepID=A0ABY2E1E8_9MICO|nr:DUF3040 domain-containing protein [Occultella glacieicola]TDE90809.1 DUF3040 domain-containing protein [Occultella glacieicola]